MLSCGYSLIMHACVCVCVHFMVVSQMNPSYLFRDITMPGNMKICVCVCVCVYVCVCVCVQTLPYRALCGYVCVCVCVCVLFSHCAVCPPAGLYPHGLSRFPTLSLC